VKTPTETDSVKNLARLQAPQVVLDCLVRPE
jgi:hypothetical protein